MQDQNEISRINRFLCMVSPIVIGQVKMILQSAGLQVEEKGSGSELIFIIKSGEKLWFIDDVTHVTGLQPSDY